MKKLLVLITLLAVCIGYAQESQPTQPRKKRAPVLEPDPPLGAGVLARVDGIDVLADDYRKHLERRTGMTRFQKFLDEVLVARKARALGVELSEQELLQAADKDIAREIEQTGGDADAFRERLRRRYYTMDSYREMKVERLRPEMLLARCILHTRQVDDEDVKKKFEEMFGVDGITHRVRHIMVSQGKHGRERARARADEVMARLEKDAAQFAELVNEFSDHGPTRRSGGVITGYRPGGGKRGPIFGESFDRAVLELERANQIKGPVRTKDGLHIIQLLERKTTRLDDVAETIRDLLVSQDPTPAEKRHFIRNLQSAARIEMHGLSK